MTTPALLPPEPEVSGFYQIAWNGYLPRERWWDAETRAWITTSESRALVSPEEMARRGWRYHAPAPIPPAWEGGA